MKFEHRDPPPDADGVKTVGCLCDDCVPPDPIEERWYLRDAMRVMSPAHNGTIKLDDDE